MGLVSSAGNDLNTSPSLPTADLHILHISPRKSDSNLPLFLIQPVMDILPPPDYPPVKPTEYPQLPTRTPPATLEKLHASCVSGDLQEFRKILGSQSSLSEGFDICDLSTIMKEAIKRNDAQFVRELLDRGLPMDPLYALEAVKVKGKDTLKVFLQNGCDINQPVSALRPPILG